MSTSSTQSTTLSSGRDAQSTTLRRSIALFLAASAFGGLVSASAPADASRALIPASACLTETDWSGDYVFRGDIGIGNVSGGRARKVYCPVPDSASNLRANISSLWIAGYDANNEPPNANADADGRVRAQICMHDDWAGGFACSNWVDVSTNTQSGIQYDMNIAAYTAANDPIPLLKNAALNNWYPNLVVALPRHGLYGDSYLYGFTTN